MKGQVPQAEGFQEEVEGTETEGMTTLGFTTLITFGIEMSSETLISAAGEEKIIKRAVACFLSVLLDGAGGAGSMLGRILHQCKLSKLCKRCKLASNKQPVCSSASVHTMPRMQGLIGLSRTILTFRPLLLAIPTFCKRKHT